jgi:nucleoside phosphorylase
MFISAGRGEDFSFSTSMGVGSGEIAINLSRFLTLQKKLPPYLLFVGTAGSYGGATIFDIVESKMASQIELSFLQKQSYTPIENIIATGEKTPIVNSSNYITTDFKLSKKFLELNIQLENMEFFSFLQVAQAFNIPAGGVFIVTNFTDSNAHNDFLRNRGEAMLRMERYIKSRT